MADEARSELITGRELQRLEGDRFHHGDIAAELADLAMTVETPANVALYGPWGSGKTGVANLLAELFEKEQLRKDRPRVAFTRFDAFKYKELPLRRYFLSQIAEKLRGPKEAAEIRDRLYRSESKSELKFPASDLWRAAWVFGLLLLVVVAASVALALLGALALANFTDQEFPGAFKEVFKAILAFGFAPAAVLGGLFAIAGKALPVERRSEPPSTDEQFEQAFIDIVEETRKAGKAQRVVVFVDELDRCSSDRVVDILDTVRTFLDVEGTVFIVAADRHVLERALMEKVQQTTPPDPTNPYYSSGSAYLDKVFHYQLSLPPLLPARVTRYAVELVEGRPGVWSDPDIRVPWVVSVLIPSHVRSPRRVKTLLNNFVLNYCLAVRRYDEGQLTAQPKDRALELAKLTCLTTEFPTFARELTLSSRLPELFLMLCQDLEVEKPDNVSEEAWDRARDFALGKISPDEMLDDRTTRPAEEPDEDEEEEEGAERSEPESVEQPDRLPAAPTPTKTALRQQLYHYLLKTRHIPSPRSDLVFLESRGSLFELDESIVESVEEAALNGRQQDVFALVENQQPPVQTNIVRLLSQRTHEAFPGVEGENLVGVLLHVAGRLPAEVLAPAVEEAIEAVSAHRVQTDLRPDDLPGALILGIRSDKESARDLVEYVLSRPQATSDARIGTVALEHASALQPAHEERLVPILAARLLDVATATNAVDQLIATGANGTDLLAATTAALTQLVNEGAPVPDGTEEDEEELPDTVAALAQAVQHAIEIEGDVIGVLLLRAGFRADSHVVWKAMIPALQAAGPLTDVELAGDVFRRSSELGYHEQVTLLALLDESVSAHADIAELCDASVETLWESRGELGEDEDALNEEYVSAMRKIGRLQPAGGPEGRTLDDYVSDFAAGPVDAQQIPQTDASWVPWRIFVDEGLLPAEPAASIVAERIASICERPAPVPPQPPHDVSYLEWVDRWAMWSGPRASKEILPGLLEAIKGCAWLGVPRRESLCLRVAARAKLSAERGTAHAGSDVESPFSADEVAELATQHGAEFSDGVSAWLEAFAHEPGEAFTALEPILRSAEYRNHPAEGVRALVARLAVEARVRLARLEVESSEKGKPCLEFLEDIGFHQMEEQAVADLLISEYERSAQNNERRKHLFDVWSARNPTTTSVRQKLIDRVLLPALKAGGKQALEHIKARPQLWARVEGRKKVLKDEFRKVAGGKDADQHLERLMRDHGLITTRSKGPLGIFGKEEVDE